MIAKIMKRSSFGNVVNYVFKDGKDAKLLASDGVRTNTQQNIIACFNDQASQNSKVKKPGNNPRRFFICLFFSSCLQKGKVLPQCDQYANYKYLQEQTKYVASQHIYQYQEGPVL